MNTVHSVKNIVMPSHREEVNGVNTVFEGGKMRNQGVGICHLDKEIVASFILPEK